VQQVFVDGNSLERFLVAVVVPDPAILKQWYKANIKDNGVTINQMVNQKEVRNIPTPSCVQ
jgi:long-subunit acyl-CoA synthetase (AMP-forming)